MGATLDGGSVEVAFVQSPDGQEEASQAKI